MRIFNETRPSVDALKLVLMGAKVEQINSKMCYVTFPFNDFEVSYVYNINKKNRYFLERIRPYPLPLQDFENEEDVIHLIEKDLKQFANASNSKNISDFIKVNYSLVELIKNFESIFLNKNIPKETILSLLDQVSIMKELMTTIEHTSKDITLNK